MSRFLFSLGVGMALLMAPAAQAATVIDSSNVGSEYTIDFTGQAGGAPAPQLSALLNLVFNGTANSGQTYLFSYSITNDSSVSSLMRSFGFDVTGGTLTSAAVSGAFTGWNFGDNFPEGAGSLDICFHTSGGNNCTGGPNGLAQGATGTGTFSLTFSSAPTSITLDSFTTRFQSISPSVNGQTSGIGIGTPVPAVPEPSTWLMFLLGFFLTGYALRSRRAMQQDGEVALAA